jgi:hypothetical protein
MALSQVANGVKWPMGSGRQGGTSAQTALKKGGREDGHLNHPLYVPYSAEPVAVEGRRSAGSYTAIW